MESLLLLQVYTILHYEMLWLLQYMLGHPKAAASERVKVDLKLPL